MPTPTLALRNNVYTAVWSDSRRSKRKSMGTANRAIAEERFAQWLLLGGHKDGPAAPAGVTLTTSELWMVYDVKHVEHIASPASARICWKNLSSHFGAMRPAEIDQTTVDEYEQKRAGGKIGNPAISSTVRKELACLRAMLNWHVAPARGKKRLLERIDVPVFDLPDERAPRDRWLSKAEIAKLFGSFDPAERMCRVERFLWLALETAARKQAILDLTWDRVDFETGMVHYALPGQKQTKKRRVSVPISKTLHPVLERMHAERQGDDTRGGHCQSGGPAGTAAAVHTGAVCKQGE
jgi:integrase